MTPDARNPLVKVVTIGKTNYYLRPSGQMVRVDPKPPRSKKDRRLIRRTMKLFTPTAEDHRDVIKGLMTSLPVPE